MSKDGRFQIWQFASKAIAIVMNGNANVWLSPDIGDLLGIIT